MSLESFSCQCELKHRINDGDKCRLLEKQILDRAYYLSVVKEGLFQVIFSVAATIALSFILTFVNILSFILPIFFHFQLDSGLLASINKFRYAMFEFLIRDSVYSTEQSADMTQLISLILSIYFVIVLSLVLTELLNKYSYNLDGVISHQIQAIPQCNEINFQDEVSILLSFSAFWFVLWEIMGVAFPI